VKRGDWPRKKRFAERNSERSTGADKNNPEHGRIKWERKNKKRTRLHPNGLERLVLGRFCRPRDTKAIFAEEGLNGQSGSINGCRKSREEAKRGKLRN
jgi:hypothetical protein